MDYDENIYRINLKSALTASDLIYELSMYLEKKEVQNKRIFLQMSDIDLSVAQLKSIRSLVNSINSSLAFISTNSVVTKESAMAMEIVISDENTNQNMSFEPEKTYKTVEEAIEEKNETAEEKSSVISIETDEFTHKDAQNVLETILDDSEIQVENNPESQTEQKEEKNADENKNQDTESIDPLDSIFEVDKKIEEILDIKPQEEGVGTDIEYYKNLDNEFTTEDLEIDNLSTMYIKQTLRSGQVVNYDGNVVIIGDCHAGSEVHATGDITVWGVLGGIAHAGSGGNTRAKIRALKMNALQLRISDSYARKPDGMNDILVEKTNVFTPEEARYIDGDIIIFKIND